MDHPLPAAELQNDGKQPYRLRIKTSTGYVAVKNSTAQVTVFELSKSDLITVPASKEIVIWPCAEKMSGRQDPPSFGDIEKIDCSDNQLSILAVNSLRSLKELKCSNNHLREIYIVGPVGSTAEGPRDLYALDCSHNRLTELDLSQLLRLQRVNCSDNRLRSLRLGKNLSSLKNLDCSNNRLSIIDLAGLVALQHLNAGDNPFGHRFR